MGKTVRGRKGATERDVRAVVRSRKRKVEVQENPGRGEGAESDPEEGTSRGSVIKERGVRESARERFAVSSDEDEDVVGGEVSDDLYEEDDDDYNGASMDEVTENGNERELSEEFEYEEDAGRRSDDRAVRVDDNTGVFARLGESDRDIGERRALDRSRRLRRVRELGENVRVRGRRDPVLAREFAKLKKEVEAFKDGTVVTKTIEWKSKSHKIQYQFNLRQLKVMREVLDQLEEGGVEVNSDLIDLLGEGIKDIEVRQKHLRIADRFGQTGWKVVEQYEVDSLAADGDDERRIRKAASYVEEQEKLRREQDDKKRGLGGGYGGFRWRDRGSRSRSRSRERRSR